MSSDKALALELYRTMLLIRLAERRIVELYPTDKIQSPIHLSIGQEAVCTGLALAMKRSDHLYGTYRSHGPYMAKGGDLKRMFAELYGKDTGCARGKGGSMHLMDPDCGLMACSAIVASTIPVAVGDALASAMSGRGRVTAAFFGDGAIDEGVFFESVNFAALKKLPVLFVLENNRYAIHSTVADRHAQTELWRIGESLGVPGTRFDGNDALEVHRTASAAIEKIRSGGGPVLLEYLTHRWVEHVGAGRDWTAPYREKGEEAKAHASDPVARLAKTLASDHGVKEPELAAIEKEILAEIEEAVRFAEESPLPTADRLMEHLFA